MPHTHFLRALPYAAILTDCVGVVRGWNEAATELFGWTAAEMLGRPLIERYPEDARASVSEHLLSAGGEWDGEFEDYHKDGSRVWIEAHVHPVRNDTGTVTGLLGVSRKISPNRAAELERERHNRYATEILNSMSAHVAVLGPDGRIREVNRAWEQFAKENSPSGHAQPSVGVDYIDLCRASSAENSGEAEPAADGITKVLQGKRSFFVLEYQCESPTENRWFAMHVTPLKTKEGGAVVAHYDITAQKLAESTVAIESRRTEMALDAAQMGVWRIDMSNGRIHWSKAVYKIVGVTEFEGTLDAWNRLIHPEDVAPMHVLFKDAMERRIPFRAEFRVVRPSGEINWLSNVAEFECDASGEVVSVVGTVQNITARKRTEWALNAYYQVLELIAIGANLQKILSEVVRLVEEQLPGSLCSVLIVDEATGSLKFGAGQSLPTKYNLAVDGIPIGPKVGSCGTSAFRKAIVTVADIASDPLWEDYRELALQHGLTSCISVPIFSSGNVPGHEKGTVMGTFGIYARNTRDFERLKLTIRAGVEQSVRRSFQAECEQGSTFDGKSARIIDAIHLAGLAIEREQAGQAVQAGEERFRAVVDSAPSAIYLKDLEGRHLFVNRATAKMFGVPQADWIGKRSSEILPRQLAEVCEQSDRAVLASRLAVEERHACRLPDGRDATILATHILLRYPSGAPRAICGILMDITDTVMAQREFERLWLHAPDPLCVAGFDGYFKQVNPAWSRLLGWSDEELLQAPYAELVHPDERAGFAEVEKRIHRGEVVRGYENRYRCRDGAYRWFSWNAIPVLDHRVIYIITRDVTEEKRLADQFHHAQKLEAVGQLASGVAHDFNNLLTVINGYTDLILRDMPTSDPQRDSLSQIRFAGQRATDLTSQLLAFSRKAIVEPKILDINQVVESSARMLRRLIGENVQLETQLASISPVKIDAGQLEQVFMNLAVNARDAMPDGGRLSISTESVEFSSVLPTETGELAPGAYVRVSVADTGTGMSPEVKARIFEPFFTSKGPGKGTGLGLATVYGIVRQAGGAISVESEPGQGTTFRILLRAERLSATVPTSALGTVAPRGTETILIAEDEVGVRKVVIAMLESQGYKVLVADTGAEAVRIVTEFPDPIDLLLTDVVMPDFGGRVLAQMVRERRPNLRILYMSGYTDDAVIWSGVESSTDWFIQKPFTRLTLARRLREVLESPLLR